MIVNWEEVVREPQLGARVSQLRARLAAVSRRILLSAECVGTEWFDKQFAEGVPWTELIEVGWFGYPLPEARRDIPYHVLGTVATRAELDDFARRRAALSADGGAAGRPIPWALVGMRTPARIAFAQELVRWQPGGFLLLTEAGPARPGSGRLTKDALERLLERARLYIWRAQHPFPYFETFRVHDALRCGALPVKIDPDHAACFAAAPCVFPSLGALTEALETQGWAALLAATYEAALARPSIGEALAAILAGSASPSS
ncbi:MAG: hypothetical protein CFK52_09725 [Chloracidobacterium sp. CP2_5A]|nr:MAG: hypothetical protein CFK52_09725 [Chloracidobacterium sp. CP2_5A]